LADGLHEGKLAEAVRLLKGRSAHSIGQAIWQAIIMTMRAHDEICGKWRGISLPTLCARNVRRLALFVMDAVWLGYALSDESPTTK